MTGAIVYIGTTNDSSGNPRRGWILEYGTANPRFCDEGYDGRQALLRYGVDAARGDLPRIDVTPSEYRSWKKWEAVR